MRTYLVILTFSER